MSLLFDQVGSVVFLAGQIGLDPASMKLVSGALSQARLSLQHIHTVLKANKSSLAAGIIGTCYYRHYRQVLKSYIH